MPDVKAQLFALQAQVNALIEQMEDEEKPEGLTPVETIKVPDPNGTRRFILGWAGVKPKEDEELGTMYKYRFDDGPLGPLTFLAYPRGLAYDWHAIARGCKDVTGALYAPYNYPSYKPAWNAEDLEANTPPMDVVEQRFKDYKGGLRASVDTWPEKYQIVWKKYH